MTKWTRLGRRKPAVLVASQTQSTAHNMDDGPAHWGYTAALHSPASVSRRCLREVNQPLGFELTLCCDPFQWETHHHPMTESSQSPGNNRSETPMCNVHLLAQATIINPSQSSTATPDCTCPHKQIKKPLNF